MVAQLVDESVATMAVVLAVWSVVMMGVGKVGSSAVLTAGMKAEGMAVWLDQRKVVPKVWKTVASLDIEMVVQ